MGSEHINPIGFLHRTAAERAASGKRPVRVVNADSIQMISDDEDDEDFELASSDSSDEEQGAGNGDEEQSDDDDEDDDDEEEDASNSDASEMRQDDAKAVDAADPSGATDGKNGLEKKTEMTASSVLVCHVCLGAETADGSAAMLVCAKCGITVHEFCYKHDEFLDEFPIKDLHTSWFCQACLGISGNASAPAGIPPSCQLCPLVGGLYCQVRPTNSGGGDPPVWVHYLCALVTPGASPNSLAGVPVEAYGARACGLCPDRQMGRTGVAVKCDAGMCRECAHVTCAQRAGLLSAGGPPLAHEDGGSGDLVAAGKVPDNGRPPKNGLIHKRHNNRHLKDDEDDQYFLTCRQHSNKEVVRVKRKSAARLWGQISLVTTTQKRSSSANNSFGNSSSSLPVDLKGFVKSRFTSMKTKFRKYTKKLCEPDSDTEQQPSTSSTGEPRARYLHTSAGYLQALAKRDAYLASDHPTAADTPLSKIMKPGPGESASPQKLKAAQKFFHNGQAPLVAWSRDLVRTEIVGRNAALPPAFAPPFVWYWQEREALLGEVKERRAELEARMTEMRARQTDCARQLDAAEKEYNSAKAARSEDIKRTGALISILELLENTGEHVDSPTTTASSSPGTTGGRRRSSHGSASPTGSSVIPKLFKKSLPDIRSGNSNSAGSASTSKSSPRKSKEKPPKDRTSTATTLNVNGVELRPLEILVKDEFPGATTSASRSSGSGGKPVSFNASWSSTFAASGGGGGRKRKLSPSSAAASTGPHFSQQNSPKASGAGKSTVMVTGGGLSPTAAVRLLTCGVCASLADQHLLVTCDTCAKAYHLACLDPPLDRMPKRTKRYGWECSFCGMSTSSSSEEEENGVANGSGKKPQKSDPSAPDVDPDAPRQLRTQTRCPSSWRFTDLTGFGLLTSSTRGRAGSAKKADRGRGRGRDKGRKTS